jgi:hypothetical protein
MFLSDTNFLSPVDERLAVVVMMQLKNWFICLGGMVTAV